MALHLLSIIDEAILEYWFDLDAAGSNVMLPQSAITCVHPQILYPPIMMTCIQCSM